MSGSLNEQDIEERRHIKKGDGNTTATMGVKAAKIAIERADIDKNDIDLILFATLSPDYYFPGSGVIVQQHLKFQPARLWTFATSVRALFMHCLLPTSSSKQGCTKTY